MMKKIYFKSQDARICGVLRHPSKRKIKDFCVVFCHGWASSKDSTFYNQMADILEEKGICTFSFDFYGHGESEGVLENATFSIAARNISDAIRFLTSKRFKKFGLCGTSFAGGASIIHASRNKGLEFLCLRSSVAVLGKRRLEQKKRKWNISDAWIRDAKSHDFLKLASKITIPALVINGDMDNTTPLYSARRLFASLAGEKMMVIITKGNHMLDAKKQRNDLVNAVKNFILHNLPKN